MASMTEGKSPAPKRCNAIINENDKKYVRVMLTAPGLRVKRQFNFSMAPKNCKILDLEYRKNSVYIKFVINEGLGNESVYVYENDEDTFFNGPIQTDKSYLKYTENGIDIYAKKVSDWSP
ncbi:hypothetical protein BpHYR1_052278 [Brachionus plicatilis]|uniref:Uncharacterized protein n=1 Tax=Brachionus plicatilis TaxID=10195 RepID=A0A3M7S3L9_BRAPC|nr:hypothetical protein BpHYR1_052278 [Brachionus plicatilis]